MQRHLGESWTGKSHELGQTCCMGHGLRHVTIATKVVILSVTKTCDHKALCSAETRVNAAKAEGSGTHNLHTHGCQTLEYCIHVVNALK